MAVTGRKPRFSQTALGAAFLLIFSGSPLWAERAADLRAQIGYIATSLSAGNAADALSPFDKSYTDYEKINGYFQGLAASQIENEVDVTDEEDTADGAQLTLAWILTLTDPTTNRTERRTAEIHVRLVLKGGKWKIVDFSPIDIFNPIPKRDLKP